MGTTDSLPTLDDLQEFIEVIQVRLPPDAVDNTSTLTTTNNTASRQEQASTKKSAPTKCPHCGERHNLVRCPAFAELDLETRSKIVKDKKLCSNCLAEGHNQKSCSFKYTCRTCKHNHHTLLHKEKQSEGQTTDSTTACHIKAAPADDTEFVDTAIANARQRPQRREFYSIRAQEHPSSLKHSPLICA